MLKLLSLALLLSCATSTPVSLFRALPTGNRASPTTDRIVGGSPVNITDYPWQASLQENGRHACGAFIISSTWTVTAAHCVEDSTVNSLTLRAGSSFHASGGTLHSVSSGYIHGYYDRYNIDYDIAALQVSSPFAIGTPGIGVIGLPSAGYYPSEGSILYVSGWGYTTAEDDLPAQLQAVDVAAISRESCRESYTPSAISDRMLCAGYATGGKDACQYDSGGPLVQGSVVVGIVSWGVGCALPRYPGVYADVGALRDWIELVTGV